ncbi:MAG TPA: DEAD/DEAH box helicase [Dehalococcoidia bacterium]|nr:DEAD/DEAH box helicase [Dehalococcoidia bacterium]
MPQRKEDSLRVDKIYDALDEKNNPLGGYEFAMKGRYTLREIIKLFTNAGHFKKIDGGYYRDITLTEIKKIRRKSRRYCCEELLKIVGDKHSAIDNDFKISLSKYHVYWHCKGIGKLRGLSKNLNAQLDIAHNKLYQAYKIRYPNVRKSPSAWETAKNYRSKLVSTLRDKYQLEESSTLYNSLSSKTVFLLEKLTDSELSFSDFKEIISKSGHRRFDRQALDQKCHTEGIFKFNSGIQPYKWQNEAVKSWMSGSDIHEPYRGIVSAVTGSGKTVMAMLAVERFIEKNPNGVISVIVPTKVLMKQWAEEFSSVLGLNSNQIGVRGDGFNDSFTEGKRVVISIVNSAIRGDKLRNDLVSFGKDNPHLLIADECHRYGGGEFSRVFRCRVDACLGLSATPPSKEEGESDDSDMNVIISALGKQFYKLSYKDAREQKLICSFTVKFVGVELENNERNKYDNLTKKLNKILERIRRIYGHRIEAMSAGSLDQKLNIIINSDENPDRAIYDYFEITQERRSLIYDATNRISIYNELLRMGLEKGSKIMVFHERIKQMEDVVAPKDARKGGWYQHLEGRISDYQREVENKLESWFFKREFRPVMYHSRDTPNWNNSAMQWYRDDVANVMLSVKALVEGVDVPAADLGIVRVSSSSIRQRIQTIGRVLRKGDHNKKAEIWIVFVENTVDTSMFRSYDWQAELGQSQIEYWHWDSTEFAERPMIDLPVPKDYEKDRPPIEVDVSGLEIGDVYPGRLAGIQFGVDANGSPFKNTREGRAHIDNADLKKAAMHLHKLKGGGKFFVTPQGNIITRIKRDLIYLGTTTLEELNEDVERSVSQKKSQKRKKAKTFDDLFR